MVGEQVIGAYNREREGLPPGTPPGLPLPVSAIDAVVPAVFDNGHTAFMSIWQWMMRISAAPEVAAPLLQALAQDKSPDAIGAPEQRAELLHLFCERDLLYQRDDGGYAYQVPFIAQWIARQRRLPQEVV